MKISTYLVIGKTGRGVYARRVTSRRPALDKDEAVIKLALDLPDDVFEAPLLTVPVERRRVAVAAEAEDPT